MASGVPPAVPVPPRDHAPDRTSTDAPPEAGTGAGDGASPPEGVDRHPSTRNDPAGRALLGADVRPMTSPDARCTAIAWKDGRILAVGDDETVRAAAEAAGLPCEDGDGTTVIPGFVDAHMHFLHVGVKRMRPDLQGAPSLQAALERVREWLEADGGDGPVTAEGWDESGWPERRAPTRQELDDVTDRPLVLRRIDGHFAVANSAALPLLRRRWDRDDLVDMETGILLEDASLYLNEVLPASAEELDEAVQEATRVAHRLGVTAVGDYSQAPFRAALLRAAAGDRLRIRVASNIYVQQLQEDIQQGFATGRPGPAPGDPTAQAGTGSGAPQVSRKASHQDGVGGGGSGGPDAGAGLPAGHVAPPYPRTGGTSPWLRDGGLKVFHDGSLGGFTAWLHEPYADGRGAGPDGCGTPNWTEEEVLDWYRQAHRAGIQVHAHAIGDRAIDQALDGFEVLLGEDPQWYETNADPQVAAGTEQPASRLRHRIEHFELPTDDAVRRTREMGIVASCQPNFVGHWSARGGMYEHRLGPRFLRNNRYRAWLDGDLPLAFGSDGMPFGPLFGLQSAVDHPLEEERITIAEAVWLYTAAAAWSLHWEDSIGALQPGMQADLLVLDVPSLEDRPPKEWVIAETIVAGQTVHRGAAPEIMA